MRLANDSIALEVRPEHGMTIVALARRGAANLLWERHGHVAPRCSRQLGPAGEASIETLHGLLVGGWFEMSPHAGLPGELDGRPTFLHGEAPRLPWRVLDAGATWVEAGVETVDTQLELWRRIELDDALITVSSTIHNAGAEMASVTHGEHPCFSRAAFSGGEISLAAAEAYVLPPLDPANAALAEGGFAWPHAPGRDGGPVDLSRIPARPDGSHDHVTVRLADSLVRIRAVDGSGLTLQIDLEDHPHLLLWRNYGAPSTPELGIWDVLALEPMSAPGRAIEDAQRAGRVRRLAPGESVSHRFAVLVEEPFV